MVGRDGNGGRFDSWVARTTDPWKMLAACVINQALEDICPRNRRRSPDMTASYMNHLRDAIQWVEGAPAALPAAMACTLTGVSLELLRDTALQRLDLLPPSIDASIAA